MPYQQVISLILTLGGLFWHMFGSSIKWGYGKYLAARVDPWLAKHVVPHFTAAWAGAYTRPLFSST